MQHPGGTIGRVVIIVLAAGLLAGCTWGQPPTSPSMPAQDPEALEEPEAPTVVPVEQPSTPVAPEPPLTFTFANPQKSAHYVSNVPTHGATLSTVPNQVSIDFNFDLAPPSEIRVTVDGVDVTAGPTQISDELRTLSVPLDTDAPEGLYQVSYTACWPDTTCHEGSFAFGVDVP